MIKGFNSLPYLGKPRVNETSIRPYVWGGRVRGGVGWLACHQRIFWDSPNWVSKIAGFPGLRIYLSYIHLTLLGLEESLIEHTSHLLANSAKKRTNYQSASFIFSCRFLGDSLCCPFWKTTQRKKKQLQTKCRNDFSRFKNWRKFPQHWCRESWIRQCQLSAERVVFSSTSKDVKKVQVALIFLVDQIWKGMKLRESNSRSVFVTFASRIFSGMLFFLFPSSWTRNQPRKKKKKHQQIRLPKSPAGNPDASSADS